jgi:flagellar assembly factor FliW
MSIEKSYTSNSLRPTKTQPGPQGKTSSALSALKRAPRTIETSRFGSLEVDESKIIVFPHGLIGFTENRRFILLDHSPGSPFHWLQSVDAGDLAFPLADPDSFVDGYVVTPPMDLETVLGPFSPEDLWLGVIATFPHGSAGVTLNLKAPLILNTRTRLGVQTVLEDPNVPIRFPISREK